MLHRVRGRWWYADLIEAVRDEYDRLGRLSWDDDGISLEKRTAWRQRLGGTSTSKIEDIPLNTTRAQHKQQNS